MRTVIIKGRKELNINDLKDLIDILENQETTDKDKQSLQPITLFGDNSAITYRVINEDGDIQLLATE